MNWIQRNGLALLRTVCGLALLFLASCASPNRNQADSPGVASLRMATSFKIANLNPTDPRAFFNTSAQSYGGPRILLNVRRAPFDEAAVRRAFGLGIQYQSLAKNLMEGIGDLATGFYPPIWPWAVQNQKTDIVEAKRLLDQSGWLAGGDGLRRKNNQPLEITLLVYPQQPGFAALATAIQAQLVEIGFQVRIRQVEDINASMKEGGQQLVARGIQFAGPGDDGRRAGYVPARTVDQPGRAQLRRRQ
jgi:peptide/nickel transport system substrate-binding protein